MTRRIVALPIVGIALALIAFGVVRGAMDAGPARGTRMVVTIDPPLDAAVVEQAELTVRARLVNHEPRVIRNGDRLVVEVGDEGTDSVAAIERVESGARPLHVVKRDAFTRTTGFFPRAWPFFAAGVVAFVIAGLLWRRAAIPA